MEKIKITAITVIFIVFALIVSQSVYINIYKMHIKFFNNSLNLTYTFTTYNIKVSSSTTFWNSQKIELITLLEESENLCKNFVLSKMITSEGAVYSTFRQGYKESMIYGVNHEVTAESIGLLMLYAIKEENKTLFDREVIFLKEKLLSPLGICYWKLREDLSPFTYNGYFSSASVDDLRIIDALIEGYNLWGENQYLSLAQLMMNGVFNYEVDETKNILVDYYVWKNGKGERAKSLTLAYARLPTLLKMAKLEERWMKIFNETLKVVSNGLTLQQLFYHEYDVKNGKYEGSYFNSIEELMIALSLVEIGEESKAFLIYNFLKKDYLKRGFISDVYSLNGKGNPSDAGIGSYALLVKLSLKLKDYDFALKIVFDEILISQEKNLESEYYGAFMNVWPDGRDANAYDNFQTLLALREIIKTLSNVV